MKRVAFELACPIRETYRVAQVRGMFDLPDARTSVTRFDVEVPTLADDWRIGAIVGPSGSGKTSVARQLWAEKIYTRREWPADASLLDGFPAGLDIRELTALLNSVGFSSPPAWLRPYAALSNGEQFRCDLARALAEAETGRGVPLVVYDEFTSVVDRTVAQIGSAAVAKAVRRSALTRFVAVTCHYDVLPWLAPDWTLDMATGHLARGSLRRPAIELAIAPVHLSAWALFRRHHYLSHSIAPTARAWCAYWGDRPVAFSAWIQRGAGGRGGQSRDPREAWREHRTVVLPDFQGVGIGNRLSEWCAALLRARGCRALSTTSHPAMIRYRAASAHWQVRRIGMTSPHPRPREAAKRARSNASSRITAGCEYVGPALPRELAEAHWQAKPLAWCDTPAQAAILAALRAQPGLSLAAIRRRVPGRSDSALRHDLAMLVADGRLLQRGRGGRRDPQAFYPADRQAGQ